MTDLILHPACVSLKIPDVQQEDGFDRARIEQQVAGGGYLLRFPKAAGNLPSAYTVGLTGLGLPELILYGQSSGHLRHAWSLLEPALHRLSSQGARVFQGQFDGQTVSVRPESLRRLPDAYRLYGRNGFTALQVYWTVGSDNHLPQQWELRFLAAQPYLGRGTLGDLLQE